MKVVSVIFSKYYWEQESSTRQVLLDAVARELYHEFGGRVYKRVSSHRDMLSKQSIDKFKRIIIIRLDNIRYDTPDPNDGRDFTDVISGFNKKGEKVMVDTRSTLNYKGIFEFDSIINGRFCYISRNHVI